MKKIGARCAELILFLAFFMPGSAAASEGVTLTADGIWMTGRGTAFEQARRHRADFKPFDATEHLNLGFTDEEVWLALTLTNRTALPQTRILALDNPLLESVALYDSDRPEPRYAGMLHIQPDQRHVSPAFSVTLAPNETRPYWLQVRNRTTTLQFGLSLSTPQGFEDRDRTYQHAILLFIGMIASLAVLSLMMYLYAKDASYLLYVLYLAALVFQQLTYTGFLPLHTPGWFTGIDNLIVVPKVALMIAAAALYARSFLKTSQWPDIDRIYRFFIFVTLVQIPLVGTVWFYQPEVTVFTGLFFILFNTAAGIMIYRRGHKEARFFIAAWCMLVVGYLLMIVDALGMVSIMYHFPELILAVTVVEALLLLLAFVDRFRIFQLQKLEYEQRYNRLLNDQKSQIEAKVIERTDALNHALSSRETLFKELHHRVKNNLQLILSIIRLQTSRADRGETAEQLTQLQGRIETIARTHELLYQQDGIETVDMDAYLDTLNRSLLQALAPGTFRFGCDCAVRLPLREAVYIGLIVNELFTNALKHAATIDNAAFFVSMKSDREAYRLEITTPCQEHSHSGSAGLGMTIIRTLVVDQLGGTLEQKDNDCTHTVIRFSL